MHLGTEWGVQKFKSTLPLALLGALGQVPWALQSAAAFVKGR